MASHHDLLEAIARVRAATGDADSWTTGLTGADIVFAGGVVVGPVASAPLTGEGAAADAIRDAEAALAHQNTEAAHIDLQVVTAVLNAHVAHDAGLAELVALQREIEAAVAVRPDLGTAAGAREFQRFLVGKLRDIREVVEKSGLDATSKASLASALAALYASASPEPQDTGAVDEWHLDPEPPSGAPGSHRCRTDENVSEPVDYDTAEPIAESGPGDPAPAPYAAPPVPPPAPAPAATMPASGAAFPGGSPFASGLPALGGLPAPSTLGRDVSDGGIFERNGDGDVVMDPDSGLADGADPVGAAQIDDMPMNDTAVELPGGGTVNAPNAELAEVISAAVAGTPIPEAFAQQGIVLPAPGSAVIAPLEPGRVGPGDIGLFTDRHALALGNGKVLLDGQIQPIADVSGPGFLGWQYPPEPEPTSATPVLPAPNRAAATAPS